MEYRKLWLINSLGERFDFTSKDNKVFLNAPEGFGFQKAYQVQKIGNSEILTSEQYVLTDVTGELLFYANENSTKYTDYQRFVEFAKYKPLELHYQTPNVLETDSWHCDIVFTAMQKGEINAEDGILHCPVSFHRLSEWLTDKDFNIVLSNSDLVSKHYELVRPYIYAGTKLQDTVITNKGTDDVGFLLEVDGYIENMAFELWQNGEVYGKCKINGEFDKIVINSVENNESIYIESEGSAVTNPEQYQDFSIADGKSYLTWCKFKVGDTDFKFTCGNIDDFDGTVTVSFKHSYVTV